MGGAATDGVADTGVILIRFVICTFCRGSVTSSISPLGPTRSTVGTADIGFFCDISVSLYTLLSMLIMLALRPLVLHRSSQMGLNVTQCGQSFRKTRSSVIGPRSIIIFIDRRCRGDADLTWSTRPLWCFWVTRYLGILSSKWPVNYAAQRRGHVKSECCKFWVRQYGNIAPYDC